MNAKHLVTLRLDGVQSTGTGGNSAFVTTTIPDIVKGLRNLEDRYPAPDAFIGPDALFSRLLAALAGTTEYDAVLGNEVERLNALYAEQVEKVETLRRERDEARAEALRYLRMIPVTMASDSAQCLNTIPTPGAQA